MSRWLTGDEQIAEVARKFPRLQLVVAGRPPWLIVWEGPLVGFDREYRVRIVWPRLSPWETLELQIEFPKVFVIEPPLADRGPGLGDRVPHLYRHQEPPYLCLLDPATDEWDESMSVADTIIPWAARWLASVRNLAGDRGVAAPRPPS